MMAERTQKEKHHLRLKLRAVAAKKSIVTAEKEFKVDKTINARFE